MEPEYDLEKMQSRRNPYAKRLKKQLTLRLDPEIIEYFKARAAESGVPYQTLINLYLRDCMVNRRSLDIRWTPS